MAESKLRNLSVEFSVKIIKLCENIKGLYSLTTQLERSGTSIGAKTFMKLIMLTVKMISFLNYK